MAITCTRANCLVFALLLNIELCVLVLKADGEGTMTFCGGKPDGLYANPQSCSSFWACWDKGMKGSLILCPPNLLWSQSSLSCSHFIKAEATNTSITSSKASASNTSILTPTLTNCTHSSYTHAQLSLPVWNWDGLLHCYGYGCLDNEHGHGNLGSSSQVDIGIPCIAAQELLSIAKLHTNAWMLAPHQFLQGDLSLIGGQHWKIRFESLEKDDASGLTILKASITDYSPSQRIVNSWQGGPTEAQFALKGPRRSPQGGCYYSVSLESPSWDGMWEHFMKDVVRESKQVDMVGSHALNRQSSAMADKFLTISNLQGDGLNMGRKGRRKRRKGKKRGGGGGGVQEACLQRVPWASLVAMALCYASNMGGGLDSVRLCSDFPSDGLFAVAKCVTTLMGISSQLGL